MLPGNISEKIKMYIKAMWNREFQYFLNQNSSVYSEKKISWSAPYTYTVFRILFELFY